MSEERNYPTDIIQEMLARHQQDARACRGVEWLAQVIEFLRTDAAAVPLPEDEADTIPEYIYPH